MDHLQSCTVGLSKDATSSTPLKAAGQALLRDETLLINESQVTFYCTPPTLSFASSCPNTRSVKKVQRQEESSECDKDVKQAQNDSIVQHLQCTVLGFQQSSDITQPASAETKEELCNKLSFTVAKDDTDAGVLPRVSSGNDVQIPPHATLCDTFDKCSTKEVCFNPQPHLQETGDVVLQNALNVTVDVCPHPSMINANVQPPQEDYDRGDGCLIPDISNEILQEPQPMKQQTSDVEAGLTGFKEHNEEGPPACEQRNTTVIVESAMASKNGTDEARNSAEECLKKPGLTSVPMNDTFEMCAPMKGGPAITVDETANNGVRSRTVNIKAQEKTKKAAEPCSSTMQNKQPSQTLGGPLKKGLQRPSLLPPATTQRRTIMRPAGRTMAGQEAPSRRPALQPLRATVGDRVTLPAKGTGSAKGHIAKPALNETVVAGSSRQATGVKPPAVPVARGVAIPSKGRPVGEAVKCATAASVEIQGRKTETARPQTARSTGLQRPTMIPSRMRKPPAVQSTQAKPNMASTPVRNDAVAVLDHAGLPTPIKKT